MEKKTRWAIVTLVALTGLALLGCSACARNRLENSEFDTAPNSFPTPIPSFYKVYPAPPSPLPAFYPWSVYNRSEPGGQLLLRVRQNMTNRMYGASLEGSEYPDTRSFYLYQTYTVSNFKDPYPPYTYYASTCVFTFAEVGAASDCKIRMGVGKNLTPIAGKTDEYDPADPNIVWGEYVSTQGYPWTRTPPIQVTGDQWGDKITVFINFENPTTDSGEYNSTFVDSVWMNTEPFPHIQGIRVNPANTDCTDWKIEWDTLEPGSSELFYRQYKTGPNTFGPTMWAEGNTGPMLRMGIDPTGGTNPSATTVTWEHWAAISGLRWVDMRGPYGLVGQAGGLFTVFVEVKNPLGESRDVWLDDVAAWDDDALKNIAVTNGNFEAGFTNDPDATHQKPNGWTKYAVSGSCTSVPDNGVYRSSSNSWKLSGSNYTIGIYQQLSGATLDQELGATVMAKGSYPSDTTHHVVNLTGLTLTSPYTGYEFEWKTNEQWYQQLTDAKPGTLVAGPTKKTVRFTTWPTVDDFTATVTWDTDVASTTEVMFNPKGTGDIWNALWVYKDETLTTHHVARLTDQSKAAIPEGQLPVAPSDTIWWQARSRVPNAIDPLVDDYLYGYSSYGGVKDLATGKFVWGGGPLFEGSIGELKRQVDGTLVQYTGMVVSGAYMETGTPFFYIEEPDRSAGIKIAWNTPVNAGDLADISGSLQTVNGEKQIAATSVGTTAGGTIPDPLVMTNAAISASFVDVGTEACGLLVSVTGKVTWKDTSYFYLDDGTGFVDGTLHVVSGTETAPNKGIRVYSQASVLENDYVVVKRGSVGRYKDGDTIIPIVWVQLDTDVDIAKEAP